VNHLGLEKTIYQGGKSTLCAGCGHDAITSALIQALWQGGVNPYKVAKMSGIGCSSKSTAYFLNKSWGFNAVHGRMPSVATGALLANRTLMGVGVSGDGDTASIGMGQFVHAVRRNVPLTYIVENNGVYGLTKGQFSATADRGAISKYKEINEFEGIDLCSLALELGATFVARSFSGDRKQLVPVLEAAFKHTGIAIVDVISPCVTFNNHKESTRSYDWSKSNETPIHEVGFVNHWDLEEVEYDAGTTRTVDLPDGSRILLRKLDHEHDPRDLEAAKDLLAQARAKQQFLTGIFYVDPDRPSVIDTLGMVDEPLATLPEERVRLSREALDAVMESFR
jgi:2-oxoglutarate ferredoxin oxidoreductase subunit beta